MPGDGSVSSPHSKALTPNPKDLFGAVKASITKLPAIAVVHGACAMMNGAVKYGPYNWRDKKVIASIYIDAASRHLMAWFEGEEVASDSQVHHLGHAIACCAIILDAQMTGNLIDDRPDSEGAFATALEKATNIIKQRAAERAVGAGIGQALPTMQEQTADAFAQVGVDAGAVKRFVR